MGGHTYTPAVVVCHEIPHVQVLIHCRDVHLFIVGRPCRHRCTNQVMITRSVCSSIIVQGLIMSAGVQENQSSTYSTKFFEKGHKVVRLRVVGWVLNRSATFDVSWHVALTSQSISIPSSPRSRTNPTAVFTKLARFASEPVAPANLGDHVQPPIDNNTFKFRFAFFKRYNCLTQP